MNTYTLQLIDDYDDCGDKIYYYIVETDKSLKEVVEAYEKARNEWYEDEDDQFDCLIAHIDMRLKEQGMNMFPLRSDAKLDF